MALEDTLPTPEGYATPAQLAAQRDYAKALLYGNQQQPKVQSWTQGVSNMVNALLGRSTLNDINAQEQAAIAHSRNMTGAAPAMMAPSVVPPAQPPVPGTTPNPPEGPTSEGQTKSDDKSETKAEKKGDDEPFRLLPQETEAWRKGVNADRALGLTATDTNVPPAVAAISAALKGNPQMAENTQVAGKAAAPSMGRAIVQPAPQGKIYVNPALIKPPPPVSDDQMMAIMNNPVLDAAAKQQWLQRYHDQANGITEIAIPGGKVRVDARNPTNQQFIPDIQTDTPKYGNGVELPKHFNYEPPTYNGNGGVQMRPISPAPAAPVAPRSEVVPPSGPALSQATPAPTPAAPPVPAPGQPNAPGGTAPPQPPIQPVGANPTPAPIRVASLDPTAGISAATPPASPQPAPTQVAQTATPLGQAMRVKPPGISDEDWGTIQGLDNYRNQQAIEQKAKEADIEVNKNARETNNKLNAKRYTDTQDAGRSAIAGLSNLKLAKSAMDDPNFYSGFGSGVVENVKRIQAALGIDPQAAAPMEVFRKTMATAIANGLKSAYAGLGQIRNKEIELQEKSNGSLATSPLANKVLIEVATRNAQEMAQVSELAQEYRLGHEVTDPVSGKTLVPANVGSDGQVHERVGLDPTYDKALSTFLKEHPIFSDAELSHFNKLLDSEAAKTKEGGTAPSLEQAVPGQIYKDMIYLGGDKTKQESWEPVKR